MYCWGFIVDSLGVGVMELNFEGRVVVFLLVIRGW